MFPREYETKMGIWSCSTETSSDLDSSSPTSIIPTADVNFLEDLELDDIFQVNELSEYLPEILENDNYFDNICGMDTDPFTIPVNPSTLVNPYAMFDSVNPVDQLHVDCWINGSQANYFGAEFQDSVSADVTDDETESIGSSTSSFATSSSFRSSSSLQSSSPNSPCRSESNPNGKNSLTKQLLKNYIRLKRIVSGKEELDSDQVSNPAPIERKMTPEDLKRRNTRRERNKESAHRSRKRKLEQIDELTAEVERLEREQRDYETEIQQLNDDLTSLAHICFSHNVGMQDGLKHCSTHLT